MPKIYRGKLVGILVKWTAGALLLAIVIFNAGNFFFYTKSKSILFDELGKRQAFIVSTIANGLSPTQIRAMNVDSMEPLAGVLIDKLNDIRRSGNLSTINLLDTSGTVIFSSGGIHEVGEFFPYIPTDRASFLRAVSGIASATELYKVGEIYLRGAYAPVFNELDEVEWVINIEAGADFFKIYEQVKRSLFVFLAISVIVAVACAIVLIRAGMELSRMEKALVNASTLASIGEMASGLAHEVRNPLAIIKASAERLKSATDEKREKLIDFIADEVARIDETLDGYLTLARPANSNKNIFLGEIASDIAERLKDKMSIKNLKMKIERVDEKPILAPENAIRRAILNILLNAIEASPEGGEISIVAKSSELIVADNGRGIPKSKMKSVFEPFYTTKPDGTGLGLTITKQIIENAGGKIELKSSRLGMEVILKF